MSEAENDAAWVAKLIITERDATITALREEVERLTARCSELSRWADGYGKLDADYAAADHELTALRQRVVEVVGPFARVVPYGIAADHEEVTLPIKARDFRAARALVNEMETTK